MVCKEVGAKVTLDGEELFTAPGEATRVLKPGKHQIVGSKKKLVKTSPPESQSSVPLYAVTTSIFPFSSSR